MSKEYSRVLSSFGYMWLNINVYQMFVFLWTSYPYFAHFSIGHLFLLLIYRVFNPLRILTICQMFQFVFSTSPFYFIDVYDVYSVILKWGKLVKLYLPILEIWNITIMLFHTPISSKRMPHNKKKCSC